MTKPKQGWFNFIVWLVIYIAVFLWIVYTSYNRPVGQTPQPATVSTEELTAQAAQAILGRPVQRNIRPDCLRNPATGRNLELDVYDDVEKIGVEYQGIQHYRFTPRFHRDEMDFLHQQERDELKRQLCLTAGIKLIEVKYTIAQGRKEARYQKLYAHLQQKIAAVRG